METVADRLRHALTTRERSIRSFQQALKAAGVRGSSYPNVHAIMKGDTEAPLAFVEAAAGELDVSVTWLAFGLDHMTPEAEADERARKGVGEAASDSVASQPQEKNIRDVQQRAAWQLKMEVLRGLIWVDIDKLKLDGATDDDDSIEGTLSYMRGFAQRANLGFIPHWVASLAEVQRRYGRTIDGETVGRALRAALDALGVDPAEAMDHTYRIDDWLNDYITAMVPALLALAPERARQRDNLKEGGDDEA